MEKIEVRLPGAQQSSAGIYVAFEPKPERIASGSKVTLCNRCGKIVGHNPRDSLGHEIVCLVCAHDVPAIHRHLEQLIKARGD